jgi:hypothetical protein
LVLYQHYFTLYITSSTAVRPPPLCTCLHSSITCIAVFAAEETQPVKRLLAMEPPPSQAMSASDDLKDKGVNEWCRFLAPLPRVLLNSHPLPCFSSRLFLTVCPSAMRFQLFVLLRLLLQHPRLPVLFLVIDAAASPPALQNF